ncbi:MAG TPA: GNAT family N-acetyltransferase [Mycobacteriales bacterium]|nr:GNAT family N-acetyltransferase [Mycobacteriales bacterium]
MSYPAHWEGDVVLPDGGPVHVRPIRPDDGPRLRAMAARLSPASVYSRFFSMITLSDRDVTRLTTVDHDDRVALVALVDDEMVGVARYARLDPRTVAEVALIIEDAHQGRHLGPALLQRLQAVARERGVERFCADVLPENRRMVEILLGLAPDMERHLTGGYLELSWQL